MSKNLSLTKLQNKFSFFLTKLSRYKISIEDLKNTSEELGLPLSYKQASLMIQAFDSDADGKVTLKEFSSIFNEAK